MFTKKSLLLSSLLIAMSSQSIAADVYYAQVTDRFGAWKLVDFSKSPIKPKSQHEIIEVSMNGSMLQPYFTDWRLQEASGQSYVNCSEPTNKVGDICRSKLFQPVKGNEQNRALDTQALLAIDEKLDFSKMVDDYQAGLTSYSDLLVKQGKIKDSLEKLNDDLASKFTPTSQGVNLKLNINDLSGLYQHDLNPEDFIYLDKNKLSLPEYKFLQPSFLRGLTPEDKLTGLTELHKKYSDNLDKQKEKAERYIQNHYSQARYNLDIQCHIPEDSGYDMSVSCPDKVDLRSNNKTFNINLTVNKASIPVSIVPNFNLTDGILKFNGSADQGIFIKNQGYSELTDIHLSFTVGDKTYEQTIPKLESNQSAQWRPHFSESVMTTYLDILEPKVSYQFIANYKRAGQSYSVDTADSFRKAFLYKRKI